MVWHMQKIFRFIDRLTDRIAYWHGTYWILASSSAMGVITGWLSTGVTWISQFGFFGWWLAGLLGALVTAMFLMIIAWVRYAWVHASAKNKWANQVDDFNPLDKEFQRRRLKIADLAEPITNSIRGKRFIDCDMVGPANIFLWNNININGFELVDCTVVVLCPDKNGGLHPGNAVRFSSIEMYNCRLFGVTVMIPPQLVHVFQDTGVTFASFTGRPEIDNH